MKNVVSLKHNIVKDLLDECRLKKDLSIRCRDGNYLCNSFLFASVFPGLRHILESPNIQEENMLVFIPDILVRDVRNGKRKISNISKQIFRKTIEFC